MKFLKIILMIILTLLNISFKYEVDLDENTKKYIDSLVFEDTRIKVKFENEANFPFWKLFGSACIVLKKDKEFTCVFDYENRIATPKRDQTLSKDETLAHKDDQNSILNISPNMEQTTQDQKLAIIKAQAVSQYELSYVNICSTNFNRNYAIILTFKLTN
jgi:hypothetical protein